MSRLAQNQKKQFTTTIVIALIAFVILIVIVLTVGLKILLNASVFIANLTQSKTKSSSLSKNDNFIGNVDIDNIPDATNSARIIVSGSVINFDNVEFYLNGDLIKETSLSASDNFSEEIGDLKKGDNEIYVIGKSKEQNEEKKSKVFNVIYMSEKPKLDIKEPQDNQKTNSQEVKVAGSTDKEIYIRVNELPVVVDAQGNFQVSVKLKEGENKIVISAQDVAGNIEQKTLTVTYEKE